MPGDQRREDQRRDDHLDQAQEQRGDDAEIVGDRLQPLGARRRAVVDRGIDRPAGDDAEHQREQDVAGQFLGHAFPSVGRDPSRWRSRASSASQRRAAGLGRRPWQQTISRRSACSSSGARSSTTRRARSMRWPTASATPFEQAVALILRLQGQADRQRARQVGPCRPQDRGDLRFDRHDRDLPPPRRSDPRRPRHGRRGRCRDPHLAERRDRRARAGDRPFPAVGIPIIAITGNAGLDARRGGDGAAGAAALARGRARNRSRRRPRRP